MNVGSQAASDAAGTGHLRRHILVWQNHITQAAADLIGPIPPQSILGITCSFNDVVDKSRQCGSLVFLLFIRPQGRDLSEASC
ncbi:MAG: hypothetical protein BM562_05235 [Alphaproteobacteria bacterium MedPE-SWcel]|nr:MAG: hypothetical protein BM562_05235 [Alphaproteobacteria bacterium MedPE-SWcel]